MAAKKKPGKTTYSSPSLPTVKRLFSVSGKRCAFVDCTTPVFDPETHSVLCQICHIKGEKRTAARYDENQTSKDRQAFDNLVLMCGRHHKIIDDNPAKHTPEDLFKLKAENERGKTPETISDADAKILLQTTRGNVLKDGSILTSKGQRGGQIAHKIVNHNYGAKQKKRDSVKLQAKMKIEECPQPFNCPGIGVLVVCKSRRPAKIASVSLSMEGTGFVAMYQEGWDKSFNYTPIKGMEKETLSVKLLNTKREIVLTRDDASKFFLPVSGLRVGPFLSASPEDLSFRIKFVDATERVLLKGQEVYDMLKALSDGFGNRDYPDPQGLSISIDAKSKTGPGADTPIGELNSKPVPHRKIDSKDVAQIGFDMVVGEASNGKWIIGGRLTNTGKKTYKDPRITFVVYPMNIGKTPEATEYAATFSRAPFVPNAILDFHFGFEVMPKIVHHARNLPPHRYGIVLKDRKKPLIAIIGSDVVVALRHMQNLIQERRDQEAAKIKHEHPNLSDAAMTVIGFHQLHDGGPGHASQIIGKSLNLPDMASVNAAYKELVEQNLVVIEKGFIKGMSPDGGPASYFTAYRLKPQS